MKTQKRSLVLSLLVCTLLVGSAIVTRAQNFVFIYNYRVLNQRVNDMVCSPDLKRLYASVPSTAGQYGNDIIVIDPFSGEITGSIFVGSEPNKIALSDDGSV